jgi:excisionase family DNA binding protein
MSDSWMSVAEAAAALKVHPRTIERRIASGKIQARRAEDGMLQVLFAMPDTSDNAPDNALETVRELAADQVSLATGSASALVKFAQSDAIRAREELALVRQETGRARRGTLMAWCVVAAMTVGVTLSVGWTAQKITRANEDVRHLTEYANRMEGEAQRLLTERDAARHEAQVAQIQSAEVSGRLAAYVEQNAQLTQYPTTRPTTRPAGFLQRLATAFSE